MAVDIKDVLSLAFSNASLKDILANLPSELISKVAGLITILKAAGIIFICYIIFKIIKGIFDIKRNIKITKTYEKVNEIDRKLNLLLGKKGIKENKEIDKKSKKQKLSKR